jgi:cytochrome c
MSLLQRAGLALTAAIFIAPAARADSAADVFANQCGICHTMSAKDPMLQGPNLGDVYGRKVGAVKGFAYSPDYTKANFVWDSAHLDAYLANPAAVLADSYIMAMPHMNLATATAISRSPSIISPWLTRKSTRLARPAPRSRNSS